MSEFTNDSVLVYLDSAPENITPELALHARYVQEETWNGWAQPVTGAAEVDDFVARWQANDPNGQWGQVTETPAGLQVSRDDPDENPDVFRAVGHDDHGQTLYDLSGWVWLPEVRVD